MDIKNISTVEQVLIIAEIGNNHEGSADVAAQMVREVAAAGADAVKFQTFRTELFANPNDQSRYRRMQRFELSHEEFSELRDLAHSLDLLFISTPLDLESARFLRDMVDAFKIASGDNNFYPLLAEVACTGKPVIISSGASDIEQVRKSKDTIERRWRQLDIDGQLAILHCVSNYPTAVEDANLSAIRSLSEQLQCEVGYSDHTLGVDACVLSVALGARIIEKHFTLDKNYSEFRDHQMSADPEEMKQLVGRVRAAFTMLGNPKKQVLPSEKEIVPLIRRSIVAARELPVGHCITADDLMWLRPAGGLAPGEEMQLVGKTVRKKIDCAEPIQPSKVA